MIAANDPQSRVTTFMVVVHDWSDKDTGPADGALTRNQHTEIPDHFQPIASRWLQKRTFRNPGWRADECWNVSVVHLESSP